MISIESNQSSCWPRSSMSWKLPMAMASRTKPSMSNGRRRSGAVSRTRIRMPVAHKRPTGRLT
jgi:hypothetical protein